MRPRSNIGRQDRYRDLTEDVSSIRIYQEVLKNHTIPSNEVLTNHDYDHHAMNLLGGDDDGVRAEWLKHAAAIKGPGNNQFWLLASPEEHGSQALDCEQSIISD